MKTTYVYKTKVIRVIDGDTFVGLVDLGFDLTLEVKFRLHGVDTPETYRPKSEAEREHGQKATAFVEGLISNQTILCNVLKYGKYGRSIVDVYVTEQDLENKKTLSDMLIENDFKKRDSY